MFRGYLVPHPAYIVPGIGGVSTRALATRKAYAKIAAEIAGEAPETIVIISPHSAMYGNYFHIAPGEGASGNFSEFGVKTIKMSVEYDTELASLIGEIAEHEGVPAGPLGVGEQSPDLDHGVMVPLFFLKAPKIVRISLSELPLAMHYKFGRCIKLAINTLFRNAVIVASGDMSHRLKPSGTYGFAPEGPEHDEYVRDCIETVNFTKLLAIDPVMCERASECGLRSLVILSGAFDGMRVKSRVLSYEYPLGVGYLTAVFAGSGKAPSLLSSIVAEEQKRIKMLRTKEDSYVRLARESVENFVKTGKIIQPSFDLPDEMRETRAGVFVSIKKHGNLRGCVGTIMPSCKNIADEIIKNSMSAASEDPRFPPIEPHELHDLVYSIDILSFPEPIRTISSLDPKKYGVIVTSGDKCGLLLPNLEDIESAEHQVAIAIQKAGIKRTEIYKLERFESVRHEV